MPRSTDPNELLPLKPLVFQIMLVLGDGELHGYAIVKRLAGADLPGPRLFPASLYRTLRRMSERGLIEAAEGPPGEEGAGRRRYFRITALGKRVARAEALRLERQVEAARAARLLQGAGP